LFGGECGCQECQADGPAPITVAVDELMHALGLRGREGGAR
jgi:hypothetical protein